MANAKSTGARDPGVKVTKRPKRDPKPVTRHSKPVTQSVHRGMTVEQIVGLYPQATTTLALYGLHCFGCSAGGIEALEEGCRGHGFTEEEIDALVADLNDDIASQPARPETLTITGDAAEKLAAIAASEGRSDEGLVVEADETGGFFLEFRKDIERGEKEFAPESGPKIRIFASALTLQRIGGSTIDFRDGRFKLDVESPHACACGKGECGCEQADS